MSLIPSESNSFADLLGRGLDGSRKSKWREPLTGPPPPESPAAARNKVQPKESREKLRKALATKKVETKGPAPALPKKGAIPSAQPPAPALFVTEVTYPPIEPEPPIVEPELKEAQAVQAPPLDIFQILATLAPPAVTSAPESSALFPDPMAQFSDLMAPLPEPMAPVVDPMAPAVDPMAPVVDPIAPVAEPMAPLPEPMVPLQFDPLPQPPQEQPIIKAPLVIQPEGEPPRRPIPIVRVPRSKLHPNGNGHGREVTSEADGHDVRATPPSLAPSFPPPPLRLRPKPSIRPRLEEEPHVARPLPPAPQPQVEAPQNAWPTPPPATAAEPHPVDPDSAWFDESPWIPEGPTRRRLQFRLRLQWQSRLVRCLTYEAVAMLVLIGAVLMGLAHRAPDDPLNLVTRILAIGAAIVAAVVPVLFYGLPEKFPREPR